MILSPFTHNEMIQTCLMVIDMYFPFLAHLFPYCLSLKRKHMLFKISNVYFFKTLIRIDMRIHIIPGIMHDSHEFYIHIVTLILVYWWPDICQYMRTSEYLESHSHNYHFFAYESIESADYQAHYDNDYY